MQNNEENPLTSPLPAVQPESGEQVQPAASERQTGFGKKLGGAVIAAVIAPGIINPSSEHIATPANSYTTIESNSPDPEVQLSAQTTVDVDNKYQQEFQTDKEDSEATRQQVRDFLEQNKGFFEEPEKIESVIITGLASAEDRASDDEQLTRASEENEALAGQRGELAKQAVIEEAKEMFGVDISGKVTLGAHEDMLSPDELTDVQNMAQQFGYDSVETMINQYNHEPTKSPPAVSKLLDSVLAERRGAVIEITSTDPVNSKPGSEGQKEAGEKGKTIPVFDRYEGYLPEEKAPVATVPEKTPPPKPPRFTRKQWSEVVKPRPIQPEIRRPRSHKDPRRSSEHGVRVRNGKRGYNSMAQSRKGRGSRRPIPARGR